jgi:hypothetical protein
MHPPWRRLTLVTYVGGCAVYTLSQSIFGLMTGLRGVKLVSFAALQALCFQYWLLLLSYGSNGMP